ncbi:9890_t:CDS:2 [Gigaspora margarita]|uniref:9890_t:CDS:1 n=1 Tax=Gigaspora margarita TaxID=4874 RepID=A0ABN7WFR4_GIGMA|nr:9890_t:CDS:2 [Gigaspora margarita]
MQLNLEELSASLFIDNGKNPNKKELINNYITFIILALPQQSALSTATLYTTFNETFASEIEKINRPNPIVQSLYQQ